eukprot:m.127011 g.127011  ORF g.127011 m.127011 type:complete len:121 (-) comp52250_c0_seq1:73-435(-)
MSLVEFHGGRGSFAAQHGIDHFSSERALVAFSSFRTPDPPNFLSQLPQGWTNETPVERLTEAEIREFQQRISSAREKHPKTGAAALKPAGPLLSDLDESEDSSLDSSDDDADDSLFSLKP